MWDYWSGWMNWPLDPDWRCETCKSEHISLTWGFIDGVCHCDVCHTVYTMRPDGEITTVPVCIHKPEMIPAIRAGWQAFKQPLSLWTDAMWETAKQQAVIEPSPARMRR
jgi:hypothetical protein